MSARWYRDRESRARKRGAREGRQGSRAPRRPLASLHGRRGRGAGEANTEDRGDGQQKGYVVLCDDERAKGFVRPVRRGYIHVGARPKYPTRDLTPEEANGNAGCEYVKFEAYPEGSPERGRSSVVGRFWTAAQLRSGCGTLTTMGQKLAETYARDPGFYSGTFCCGCGAHFPVGAAGEFVWDGTDERVGT